MAFSVPPVSESLWLGPVRTGAAAPRQHLVIGGNERSPAALAWALAPGTLLAGAAGGIAFLILPIAAERAGLPVLFLGVILATTDTRS